MTWTLADWLGWVARNVVEPPSSPGFIQRALVTWIGGYGYTANREDDAVWQLGDAVDGAPQGGGELQVLMMRARRCSRELAEGMARAALETCCCVDRDGDDVDPDDVDAMVAAAMRLPPAEAVSLIVDTYKAVWFDVEFGFCHPGGESDRDDCAAVPADVADLLPNLSLDGLASVFLGWFARSAVRAVDDVGISISLTADEVAAMYPMQSVPPLTVRRGPDGDADGQAAMHDAGMEGSEG